jgi:hypothetical protein
MIRLVEIMGKHTVWALAAALWLAAGSPLAGAASGSQELQAARDELRLRVETERRMRQDFESLLAGGQMSATEVADFEEYLLGLGNMVDRQRVAVAKLEGTQPHTASAAALPADFNRGQTDAERIALLDAELGGSLHAFDEELLREQRELAEKSRSSSGESGDGADGGDGASGKAGEGQGGEGEEKAGDMSAGSAEGGSAGTEQQSKAEETGKAGGDAAEANDKVASAGGASEPGTHAGRSPPPPDIPDGKDDDIVARQLREAAETEQDPELRKKLWDEYRKYKNRTR